MKLGYSMLLGEYIKAESLDYEDCKSFQIVCPACNEPVFKVVRDTEAGPLNYLSHYKSDSVYVSECELRVEAISSDEAKAANSKSRNQFIKHFMSVLRETIISSEYKDGTNGKKATVGLLNRLEKSKGLAAIRETTFAHSFEQIKTVSDDELNEYFDSYVDDVTLQGEEDFNTQFSLETTKRIGGDIWKHLLSPKMKPNYNFIFNHAYLTLLSRLELSKGQGTMNEWEEYLYVRMQKLISAKKQKAEKIVEDLRRYQLYPPITLYPSSIFIKMMAEITHEILGCLLRLPYLNILKTAKNGELS